MSVIYLGQAREGTPNAPVVSHSDGEWGWWTSFNTSDGLWIDSTAIQSFAQFDPGQWTQGISTPVPEPSTVVCLFIGGILLAALTKWRKRDVAHRRYCLEDVPAHQ